MTESFNFMVEIFIKYELRSYFFTVYITETRHSRCFPFYS